MGKKNGGGSFAMKNILIYYPKGFVSEKFLKSKIKKIINSDEAYVVTAVADYSGLLKIVFPAEQQINLLKDDSGLRRNFKATSPALTHAIVFWDGRDFDWLIYEILLQKIPYRLIPVKVTRVANRDNGDKYDVYIGRGTPWGNPFPIGEDGQNRADVIEKFKVYFETEFLANSSNKSAILSLRGKTLGCHCKPLPCHGDIIANYLDSLENE